MDIVDTANYLQQGMDDPLAVYEALDGTKRFVTGGDMTAYLRLMTASVYPNMMSEQLKLISSHSLRVTACVLLHEAGKDGTYIKLRLRWLSDCFVIYLRNSDIIVEQHDKALEPFYERMQEFAVEAGLLAPDHDVHVVTDTSDIEIDDDEDVSLGITLQHPY